MENGRYFLKIVIAQFALVVILLASVLIVKYFLKSTYNDFKKWYEKNVAVDTDVYEVLGDFYEI